MIEHKLVKIDVSDIKLDKTNPNVMSKEEFESLEKVMKKYGYLAPVILDKKNKVVDGEHRVKVYQKLGRKQIPAYVIDVDRYDQKILRQVMNKLRGEHDIEKDSKEFDILANADRLGDLAKLLAKNESDFLRIATTASDDEEFDTNPMEHYEDSFLHGNIKQIMIYFDNEGFEKTMKVINEVMRVEKVETHTDMFMKLLEYYENNKLKKEKP